MKTTREIRQEFIEFFKSKDHVFVPSVPVVPKGDPTLMFVNAGMNPFKGIFLGEEKPKYKRVANSQACIRVSGKHNDLEEVGKDTYHHTFFEMLGNWSFGDYYKREAIRWAWELITKVWGIPKERLYATVHYTDDEAEKIWYEETDILPGRVLKFGDKDNFWEMGETGPCGPCSEIHIDLGEEFDPSPEAGVNTGSPRFIEIWNLVFIQYYRDEQGNLHPLKDKFVDTGMGLERITSILQGTYDNYAIDIFDPIRNKLKEMTGIDWKENEDVLVAYRVIMDHIRAITFAVNDGVIPSNEGRGYVIRRILRRAFRYGRKLNLKEPFLYKLVDSVIDAMGDYYTSLKNNPEIVKNIIKHEEERFNRTIDNGLSIFYSIVEKIKKENKDTIDGKDVFLLYDTYGFPVDLTRVMAEEEELKIDESGFEVYMQQQRERARKASKFTQGVDYDFLGEWVVFEEDKETEFVGYEKLEEESKIIRYILHDGKIYVILDKTPFYAESGGQVADKGIINGDSFKIIVEDVQKYKNFYVHIGILEGNITSNKVVCKVDKRRREDITRNHSATHLLHSALRKFLGKEVRQAGSFVSDEKLRFDFTYNQKVSSELLKKIEKQVNEWILNDYKVKIEYKPIEEAKKEALAFFEEKYGDIVRVVKMGDVSSEFCGGTHVDRTSYIGSFVIITETSVASGIRRIEALTGREAIKYLLKQRDMISDIKNNLEINKEEEILNYIVSLKDENKKLKKEVSRLKASASSGNTFKKLNIGEIEVYIGDVSFDDKNELKLFAENFEKNNKDSIFIGIGITGKKKSYLVIVGSNLVNRGIDAGAIVREIAKYSGGKGGGRKNLAQANIGDEEKIKLALNNIANVLKELGYV